MKKLKLFMAAIIAVVSIGGMELVNAATGSISASTTNHAITLSRAVTGVSNKVTNTFTYTVTAVSGNPSGASSIPTGGTVAFSGVSQSGGTATATGTIDFAGATFTTNGDYAYTIKETGSTDSTTYPVDSTNTYTVKISVRNASATNFDAKTVTMILFKGEGGSATKLNNTTFSFTKAAVFRTITIKKTVEGTMADAGEYFTIPVTIGGAAGDSFTISGQSKSGATTACTVASGATTCTASLQLKHNETATISGVKDGATYSFTESGAASYQTYINGITTNSKSSGNLTVGETNTNTIKNTYSANAITGIFSRYTPYIAISAVAIAGIAFVVLRQVKYKKLEALEE